MNYSIEIKLHSKNPLEYMDTAYTSKNHFNAKYLTYKVFDQWYRNPTILTSIVGNSEGTVSLRTK